MVLLLPSLCAPAESHSRAEGVFKCLQHYATEMDDGHSDVATIAAAVASECETLQRQAVEIDLMDRGSAPTADDFQKSIQMLGKNALLVVLKKRAGK
jgi:hypothetical protein